MSIPGKWFGFDYGEVLDVAIALYNKQQFDEAMDAFESIIRDSSDDWFVLVASSYAVECRNRLSLAPRQMPYLL